MLSSWLSGFNLLQWPLDFLQANVFHEIVMDKEGIFHWNEYGGLWDKYTSTHLDIAEAKHDVLISIVVPVIVMIISAVILYILSTKSVEKIILKKPDKRLIKYNMNSANYSWIYQ